MNLMIVAAAAAASLLAATSAEADILHYQALLKGANAATPSASHGRGQLSATLDTDRRQFDYTVTYSDLSGPATAASLQEHGRAADPALAVKAPSKGAELHATVQLTRDQVNDLNAGHWSFKIDTVANPGGEISGELQRSAGEY
jgi:hypothetical protein